MNEHKTLFESKVYNKFSSEEKKGLFYVRAKYLGIALLILSLISFFINFVFLDLDVLNKLTIIVSVFGFISLFASILGTNYDNELKFGKLTDTIYILEKSIMMGDKSFNCNELSNIKYIVTDFKGKEPSFFHYDLQYNIKSYLYGTGVLNWISFTHKDKDYKFFFFLENKKHFQVFEEAMNLLITKGVKIKKAFDY